MCSYLSKKKNYLSSSGTAHVNCGADLRFDMDRSYGTPSLFSFVPRIEILGYHMSRGAASLVF